MKSDNDTVFIDTSIAIARVVNSREMKRRIEARLKSHTRTVTSLVVKQEFKRRLLKEAHYLLKQLNDKASVEKVMRHVQEVLPPQQQRKKSICLDMLITVFESATDEERTERALRYLRQLLRVGLADFTDSVDFVIWESGCACSAFPVAEKVPYKRYELGPERCSRVSAKCGIAEFFSNHADETQAILTMLRSIPEGEKSEQLRKAEAFIEKVLSDPASIYLMDPCLTVGDLLIALESAGVNVFYTMNSKESQHLCRSLDQTLIVRPKNPAHEDTVCLKADPQWPKF